MLPNTGFMFTHALSPNKLRRQPITHCVLTGYFSFLYVLPHCSIVASTASQLELLGSHNLRILQLIFREPPRPAIAATSALAKVAISINVLLQQFALVNLLQKLATRISNKQQQHIVFSLVLCGCTLNMPTVQSFFLTVKLSYPLISFRKSFFRVSLGDLFGFLFPYTCSI